MRCGTETLQGIKKKEVKGILKREIWNCLDCDANRKWMYQANQTNPDPNKYKTKPHCNKGLCRVEVHQALQQWVVQMENQEAY